MAKQDPVKNTKDPLGTLIGLEFETIGDIRREMCKVYWAARYNRLDYQKATKLSYMLQNIFHVIDKGELEIRIRKIEEAIEGKKHDNA